MTKGCFRCKTSKPVSEFQKKTKAKDGLHPLCKECKNSDERAKRDPSYSQRTNLKKMYGMTPEQYWALRDKQAGVCAICEEPEKMVRYGKVVNLAVDHCHKTGIVRGLLCSSCNRGIGKLKDSPKILKSALLYLLDYEVYVRDYENTIPGHREQPQHRPCMGAVETEREHEPVDGVQLRS